MQFRPLFVEEAIQPYVVTCPPIPMPWVIQTHTRWRGNSTVCRHLPTYSCAVGHSDPYSLKRHLNSMSSLAHLFLCHSDLYSLKRQFNSLSSLDHLFLCHSDLYSLKRQLNSMLSLAHLFLCHSDPYSLKRQLNSLSSLAPYSKVVGHSDPYSLKRQFNSMSSLAHLFLCHSDPYSLKRQFNSAPWFPCRGSIWPTSILEGKVHKVQDESSLLHNWCFRKWQLDPQRMNGERQYIFFFRCGSIRPMT